MKGQSLQTSCIHYTGTLQVTLIVTKYFFFLSFFLMKAKKCNLNSKERTERKHSKVLWQQNQHSSGTLRLDGEACPDTSKALHIKERLIQPTAVPKQSFSF